MDQAIDRYLEHQRQRGNREDSITTTGHRLRQLLGPVRDAPAQDLTHRRAQRLYDALAETAAVDTHRNALGQARSWAKWCAKRGYLGANPFADVEGVGRRKAGEESKPQLTVDEARKLTAWCLEHLEDPGAVGALVCLGLGLRASEACALEPRDLDDGGQVLIVRGTKSDKARRRLHVPEWLQPVLKDALPLGYSRYALRDRVKRTCLRAGVSEVGPHSLRGTHATLASGVGAASELVAQSLGHASAAVTERHYSSEESRASARAEAAGLKLLRGGK